MPQLSPVTDVSTSSSICLPSTVHASTSVGISPPRSTSVRTKSTTDVTHTQLYCVCRMPYDETKYVILLLVMFVLILVVTCEIVSVKLVCSFSVTVILRYQNLYQTLILKC